MSGKTVVVYSCAHASPEVSNERFDWLGKFLFDLRPDYVVDLGDGADMKSLNTFDSQRPQAIVSQNYERDIEVYNDSQERIRRPFKQAKKKRPAFFGFAGNHEHRIQKAITQDPRLEGQKYGISLGHLQTDYWFDEYHNYENSAPALVDYDGVLYGHFVSSGNFGAAMSTKHHGYSLVEKLACSASVGHSHKFSYYHKTDARPAPLNGLVVGCFKGAEETWAGQANRDWRKGLVVKHSLENGDYDIQWVSMERLKKEYS